MTMSDTYDTPDTRDMLDRTRQGVIGQPLDRPEGPLKVAGQATYAAEYARENCAEGVLVGATISTGRVTAIHKDEVLAMPGVLGVYAAPQMLRRPAQGTAGEAPLQDPSRVDYPLQPVALVVAETFEQATAAAKALRIDYDDASDKARFLPTQETAEAAKEPVTAGDLEAALRDAAHVIDANFTTPGHASAAMEPHAAVAEWDGDDLTLWGSLQMIAFNVAELADSLGIDPKHVRILSPYVGGGFGSKLGISHEAVAASLAARELGRPVRVVMSRQLVFQSIMRRSETVQRIRLGAGADGRLTAFGHEALVSNLPEESFSEPVTQASEFLYAGDNRLLGVRKSDITRLTAGSVRAPGEAVGMQALEVAMDELAIATNLDPVELRKRNLPETVPGQGTPYSSRRLVEALDAGAAAFGWDQRSPTPCARREGEWWIGMGMSSAARVNILAKAEARVTLTAQGHVVVETDHTDIGTGSYAIFGQIAAEMLGQPIDRTTVKLGDSLLPAGSGSGGSWGASSTGSAVFYACEAIRATLAQALGCSADQLILKDGQAWAEGVDARPVTDLLTEDLTRTGKIEPGELMEKVNQSTYGAFFCEVAVNAFTGETRLRRMTGAFGFGRVLNAKTARSQCIGGMVWGIGSALTEELSFDARDGHLVNHDLAEYHVPVHADIPPMEVILLEERDADASPLQSKGVGELGICGAAGAIANAIYNACGVRLRDFPMTPDKLLADLPDPFAPAA
ncbi:xanthine dehydrogenase family protein molybdopterin-binding subunit [Paracoccus gahaiensis]|uniref:Xanthine dehydrogenase family protein molybdopterin-binding subunit n=1 Tax=Paracoccus gahaiensis TaxID=1706839 RepID=A0A4U0RCB0_9RHOB|nr:xanthine dehydrogenase family protein molybdopterin-binding subunit [Paracoccus gahaiensis]TJZ92961.1 xanthine dehydrogenase family protein molybdopterin-binding subunit [Paracoccus gahaiensis]